MQNRDAQKEGIRHNKRFPSCGVKCLKSSSVAQSGFFAGKTVLCTETRPNTKRGNLTGNGKIIHN
jgi:hypothetical protein